MSRCPARRKVYIWSSVRDRIDRRRRQWRATYECGKHIMVAEVVHLKLKDLRGGENEEVKVNN